MPIQAATVTAPADQDSWIRQEEPNNNFSTETVIKLRYTTDNKDRRGVVRFNLSAIPAGAVVTSATAYFWIHSAQNSDVTVHRITDSWTEAGVTWNNTASDYDPAAEGSFSAATNNAYRSVDLTALVRDWVDGTYANHGVMLLKVVQDGSEIQIKTIDDGNPAKHPYMEVTYFIPPEFVVTKTSATESDPYNGTTNPKAIPGAAVRYTVTVTNQGAGSSDADTVIITEPVPANTTLFVGDLGGAGSGPVAFADGAPSSGLTYSFSSLGSATDDVAFSSNGGSSYGYTPSPDGDGYDASVTHMRVIPQGTFAASGGGGDPSFQLQFRVRIE